MSEWISVKKKPELGDTVLVYRLHQSPTIQSAVFLRGYVSPHYRGFYWAGERLKDVTHWMPLPDPPKEAA